MRSKTLAAWSLRGMEFQGSLHSTEVDNRCPRSPQANPALSLSGLQASTRYLTSGLHVTRTW